MNAAQPQLLASGQPRYKLLAQALMDDIRSGRYPIDSLLPTEHELCQQFNVSRHTVREAFRRLSELGLISRQPGGGTRVTTNQVASRCTQASDGIESLYEYVRDVHLEITGSEDLIADEELAERLDCRPGQVFRMNRRYWVCYFLWLKIRCSFALNQYPWGKFLGRAFSYHCIQKSSMLRIMHNDLRMMSYQIGRLDFHCFPQHETQYSRVYRS